MNGGDLNKYEENGKRGVGCKHENFNDSLMILNQQFTDYVCIT
jgi:hypothetical protein